MSVKVSDQRVDIDFNDLVSHFEGLEDPQSEINRKHSLVDVIIISLIGILSGANGPSGIRAWAVEQEEKLSSLLALPHGIPSRDVIRRVLSALKPAAFQTCFGSWLASLSGTCLETDIRHMVIAKRPDTGTSGDR